jgi:acyl-CoA dehydrogenase
MTEPPERAAMEFTISPRVEDYRARIAAFVDTHIVPLESDPAAYDGHGNINLTELARLRGLARDAGLWCLQLRPETGGAGLDKVGMAVCYEAMNRSIFGPVVFNSAAPDDGNMMVLEKVATPAQKERWLAPIVDGRVRSAFAMTEPHPGGGSDPGMIQTRAERRGDTYVVTGRKWYITGAEEAAHFILMARTSDDARKGLTAFLFHKDQPGWEILRRIPIMGPEEHGGHCELLFDGLEIPAENVLMNEGDGLKLTQIRLGPARLTHCMRWLGLSKRCVEIARAYAAERHGFGIRLADRESIQLMLGDLAMRIEIGRLLVMKAAWALDQGSTRGQPPPRGGRRGDPDQRRPRLLHRHAARMDLPLRPAGPAGGRRRRSPQDGAQPEPGGRGRRLLVLAGGRVSEEARE